MKKTWRIVENHRPRMNDGVHLYKEDDCYSIYRYIDDWDEEGDTICDEEEYLSGIPEQELKTAIRTTTDSEVVSWIKKHLIKERSNSLDAIVVFLEEHNVRYSSNRSIYPF